MKEKLYSVKEAGEVLHYNERTIREWCQNGKLSGAFRVGSARKWLIPESTLYQLRVDSKTQEAKEQIGSQTNLQDVVTPEFQRAQMEHIKGLQELARSVIQSIPELPNFDDLDNLDSVRFSLWQVFTKLTGDALWPMLAVHLGEEARALQDMTYEIEPPSLVPPWKRCLPVEPYKECVKKAFDLITDCHLRLVADSGDTREWEYYGLVQRCPWCPIQTYQRVEITQWDYETTPLG